MSLTAQPITFYAGDTTSATFSLSKDGAAFTPGVAYNLIFTAKRNLLDEDRSALFQYSTGLGLTHSTTNAVVAIHPTDTRFLGGKTLHCDIKAQDLSTGEIVATVAIGTLIIEKNVGRLTETTVPGTVATAGAPYATTAASMAGAITAAPTITPITGDEIAPALSGGVLGKFSYTAIKTWILSGLQIAWGSVTGKPSTFPPDSHPHVSADVTDATSDGATNKGAVLVTDINGALKVQILAAQDGVVSGTNGPPAWYHGLESLANYYQSLYADGIRFLDKTTDPPNTRTGRLSRPASLSGDATWTLPNADGTLALTSDIPDGSAYATAAQGTRADTALQPADILVIDGGNPDTIFATTLDGGSP